MSLASVAGLSLIGTQQANAVTAPVWCGTASLCSRDYVHPGLFSDGYWMLRRNYVGELWWRVTLCEGCNNSQVAPITCENYGACVVVYYKPLRQTGYWMARRWNDYDGSHWVRLSDV